MVFDDEGIRFFQVKDSFSLNTVKFDLMSTTIDMDVLSSLLKVDKLIYCLARLYYLFALILFCFDFFP